MAARGAADDDPAATCRRGEGALPGRLSDRLDDDIRAGAAGRVANRLDDVVLGVAHGEVRPELECALELLPARRRHDRPCSERTRELERGQRHAAADPPDEHPLALAERGFRDEHSIRGLEHERERGALLERQRLRERVELGRGNRLQLALRAVRVLADHGDPTVVDDPGVDHDPVADVQPRHAFAERRDHPGAVRAEDPRLRNRREALPNPDVEMVEAGGPELDQRLARPRLGIGDVLVAEDVRPSVLVDANGFHGQNPRMTAAELSRLRGRPRPRRGRGGSGRGVRGDGAAHPRAQGGRAVRGHALHDGEAGGLVPSGAAARRRPHGRLRGALLLRARTAARSGRGSPGPVHLAGLVRGPARRARRARTSPRWPVPRLRRLQRARRPRGRRSRGSGVLRQEHDGDHAPLRLLGRARNARHGRRDRVDAGPRARLRLLPALHRRVSDGRAGHGG